MNLDQLTNLGEIRELVARGSAFLSVFLLWVAGIWIWWLRRTARARRVAARLGMPDPNAGPARELRLWSHGEEFSTVVQTPEMTLRKRLERWRQQSRIEMELSALILAAIGVNAGAFAITYVFTESLLAAVAAVIVASMFLWSYAKLRAERGIALFETQLVDALDLAARSLRAGHPLTGAFQLAGEEIPAPVGSIFNEVCQQQDLGLSLQESLRRAASMRQSADLKLFSTSVIIQLESGGNLADMMDRLAAVIRDRLRLSRHARVLTAQTQLSKRILIALPFILFFVINFLNPGYMEPLYTSPDGQFLIAMGATSLLIGMWVMNRMVVLKY